MMKYFAPTAVPGEHREVTREELASLIGDEEVNSMEDFALDNEICESETNAVVVYSEHGWDKPAEKQKSPNWGGARPGSGRRPTDRKPRLIRLTDDEYERLKPYIDKVRKGE